MRAFPPVPFVLVLAAALVLGCGHAQLIPGTGVADTEDNRQIIRVLEQYRERMMEKNVEGLLALASDRYFEDSGTPRSDDDYGYQGLKDVLLKRLSRVRSIRYEIEYRKIDAKVVNGQSVANVEVFLNGAFELASESGDRYRRVSDYNRFVLEHAGDRWKFLSGM